MELGGGGTDKTSKFYAHRDQQLSHPHINPLWIRCTIIYDGVPSFKSSLQFNVVK
jgi:hypothetical protein